MKALNASDRSLGTSSVENAPPHASNQASRALSFTVFHHLKGVLGRVSATAYTESMAAPILASLLTENSLAASASSKVLAALNEPTLHSLLDDEDIAGLLSHWGGKIAYSSSDKDSVEKAQIIERLIELGANPWKVQGLISKWVSGNQVKWVRRALEMPADQKLPLVRNWLRESVLEDRVELTSLLIDHGADLKDRAAGVLFNAKSKRMVGMLCERGADMNQSSITGSFPLTQWLVDAESKNEKLILASGMACAAATVYLKSGRDIVGEGFDLLPFACSLTDARRAAAYGNMTESGFESMGVSNSKEMVSVLSGWAWRVLCCPKDTWPSIRDSAALMQQCSKNPEGILDDEWFIAAAAADALCVSKEGSASRLSDVISKRVDQLKLMPSLSGIHGSSRWDDVLGRAAKASYSTYRSAGATSFLPTLSHAALKRAIICVMQGRQGVSAISDVAGLNALAVRSCKNSSPAFIAEISRSVWSQGIPEIFWEVQDYVCPSWFSYADENIVAKDLSRRANEGAQAPSGLVPTSKWSESLKSWVQSHDIAQKTAPASSHLRPRRM